MSRTSTRALAFGAIVAQALGTHLGARITPEEAAEVAYTALVNSGWRITEGLGRPARRISPTLWEYDPTLLAGLARGRSTAEISTETGVAYGTVKHRMESLRSRLGARNSAHAVAIAYRSGWMRGLAPEPRGRILLTPRQYQALELVADGMSNDEIAAELGCSSNTAITHLRRTYASLGALRPDITPAVVRPYAVALAYQHGHLPLPAASDQSQAA
ncbi:response regulator transcription factor [Streptomyces nymphaeiformis]|jgi:DNA-binding CsgD family transcriptional regulator|uniref:DNA-binding CsgD family transcriptional regulator n=1 Tax=Streptomyces nymphaeiformis TaxID=2663842 RepID=A0A7W7U9H0_9ACTN|nr:helix-turn-helix transcriptional regulator [Streptomyces nymphaeiformis]MBB4987475.1 DNA-binding CsgD family transcriptional regulator [Streptomyces nymphaeiformis]